MKDEKSLVNINKLGKTLIAVYREFHKYPELANEEVKTTKTLHNLLTAVGIHILDLPLDTG